MRFALLPPALRHALAAALALFCVSPLLAGPLDDGIAAYHAGDYPAAEAIWRPLAEQGNARAQFDLGYLYERGWGVPQSDAEAARWYRAAADQDDPHAEFNLGIFHATGRGMPADLPGAIRLFQRAGDQGYYPAERALGVANSLGQGVEPDWATAYFWLSLAAAQSPDSAARAKDAALVAAAAKKLSDAEIGEIGRRIAAWQPRGGATADADRHAQPSMN